MGCHGPRVGGVRGTPEEGDGFGAKFGFDSGFAQNVNLLGGGEFQDARDVDGSGVGRAEDLVLGGSGSTSV